MEIILPKCNKPPSLQYLSSLSSRAGSCHHTHCWILSLADSKPSSAAAGQHFKTQFS